MDNIGLLLFQFRVSIHSQRCSQDLKIHDREQDQDLRVQGQGQDQDQDFKIQDQDLKKSLRRDQERDFT